MTHSQCGRACSARYGTEHPLGQRCTSPPAGGSTSPVGSGRRTGRWTAAPTSGCHPRFHYTSGSDHQTCRSCASQSPCTSAGRADNNNKKYKMHLWAETNLLWFKCFRLNQSFLHYIFSICVFELKLFNCLVFSWTRLSFKIILPNRCPKWGCVRLHDYSIARRCSYVSFN